MNGGTPTDTTSQTGPGSGIDADLGSRTALPPALIIKTAQAASANESRLALAQWLPAIIDVDRATVLVQNGNHLTQLLLNAGLVTEVQPALTHHDTVTGVAMHRRESIRVPDTSTQRGDDANMLAVAGLRSSLHVPIVDGERSVGALLLADHRRDFFTATHQEAIEAVAALLALTHTAANLQVGTRIVDPNNPVMEHAAGAGQSENDTSERPNIGLRRQRSVLRTALQHGEIGAQFQPVFRYPRRELISIESLARWNDASRTQSASEFLSQSGLTHRVTQRVLEQTVGIIRDLIAHNVRPPQFALNVAGADVESIVAWWAAQPLPHGSMAIEVPMTDLLSSFDTVADAIRSGQRQGAEFFLDDVYDDTPNLDAFSLPLAGIKLSMALTRAVAANPDARETTERLVTMARRRGIYIIAKGVETIEQADILRSLGITQMQGYLFLPPVSQRELLRYIAPRTPIAR